MKRLSLILAGCLATLVMTFGQFAAAPQTALAANSSTKATKLIQSGLCAGSNLELTGDCTKDNTNAGQTFNKIIRRLINLLSAVVGVVAVIMIIIGGFRYITSGGNDTSVAGAKNTILYAIIGLIIVALAQVIVHFVLQKVTNS